MDVLSPLADFWPDVSLTLRLRPLSLAMQRTTGLLSACEVWKSDRLLFLALSFSAFHYMMRLSTTSFLTLLTLQRGEVIKSIKLSHWSPNMGLIRDQLDTSLWIRFSANRTREIFTWIYVHLWGRHLIFSEINIM